MSRISLFKSSSTHLAVIFSLLLAVALILFTRELQTLVPGSDMARLSLYAIITVLLMIAAGLFFVSYYVTKRINTIIRTAETIITTGDLSARVPVDNHWDDLSTLSEMINTMLIRIEESVEAIRTVSDNIAHDLRTPLTRMRNRIEQLQNPPHNQSEYALSMSALLNECDQLLQTFQALLRISRIEHQHQKDRFRTICLSTLLHDVIDLYEPLAAEKRITLNTHLSEISLFADRDLLFQCVANLLDNAIKHTPENGSIGLHLEKIAASGIRLIITDSGSGIPDILKERVFTRFVRGEHERASSGNGLGLALVAAIVKLHRGSIRLSDHSPSGLKVTLEFP